MAHDTSTGDSSRRPHELEHLSIAELYALGDERVRQLLAAFLPLTHASEIGVWVKDPDAEQLVALFDTSGPAGGLEMKVRQPLNTGIISEVYCEQKEFVDQGVWHSAKHSDLVDKALNQVTQNEMCVPMTVGSHRFGVMTAVQLTDARHGEPTRWGFDEDDLRVLAVAALAVGVALERALLIRGLPR